MSYVLKWKKADNGLSGRMELPSQSKSSAIEWSRDLAQNLSQAGMTDFMVHCPDGEIVEIKVPPSTLLQSE